MTSTTTLEVGQNLINRLRETASKGVSVWADLQKEAADAIEALQAEVSTLDVLLEECKMDWSGDVTQIKAEHKREIQALQAENERIKADFDLIADSCVAAQAKCDALAAKLVPLEADAERLDWLQAQGFAGLGWVARNSTTGRGYRLHQDAAGCVRVRDAIDAAKGGQHEDA
jgi:chromosome segregation ATPase